MRVQPARRKSSIEDVSRGGGNLVGRASLVTLACLVAAGCNLFTPLQGGGGADQGSVDGGIADGGSDVGGEVPDGGRGGDDGGGDGADAGCVPETDEVLCAALGATCGTVLAVPETDRTEIDVPANATGCGQMGPDGAVNLCGSGDAVEAVVEFAADGEYLFELVARADLIALVPGLVELSIDGTLLSTVAVTRGEVPAETHTVRASVTAGAHTVAWTFINDGYFNPEYDRNVRVVSAAVLGPLQPLTDRCGNVRDLDCGACGAGEVCGLARANECSCACPADDGSCVESGDHPTRPCLVCDALGWAPGVQGCTNNDPCTFAGCIERTGLCWTEPLECDGGPCRVGSCGVNGCEYSPRDDGTACGVGGACLAGECGCPDGVTVETQCLDGKDNDCDGLTNCEDSDCDGLNCGGGKACSMGLCQ